MNSPSDQPSISPTDWARLETIIRTDAARRGVPEFRVDGRLLAEGELEPAARSLSGDLKEVAIVTGFCVFDGDVITAETDGPPGALFLARAIRALGGRAVLVTDQYAEPLLRQGLAYWQLTDIPVEVCPIQGAEAWIDAFFERYANLSHVVSVERVGPNHTLESLQRQSRPGGAPIEKFESLVPAAERYVCRNMRGRDISPASPPLHGMFERAEHLSPRPTTIAVADGGNEIGMGRIPWEWLCDAIATGPAPLVACQTPTDWLVVCGICNWGAYALAFAAAALNGRTDLIRDWNRDDQCGLIEHLIATTDARDGITGRREATVDTVPLQTYGATFEQIRQWALQAAG